ncbi:M43 family zinc metalloprotease [Algoriphagus lutimaris]|uniref:M43 family zinc metalloprotease n=1 Tax=Algoriphagus lutimaris TaxID=613197 RepID=UPI001FAFDEBE|nr:M43 family zinc metalloprotease [Algoriphagus lutimaris]
MKKGFRFYSKATLLLFGAIFTFSISFAQQFNIVDVTGQTSNNTNHAHTGKCAHTFLEAKQEKELGFFGTKQYFESWVDQKIEARKANPQISSRANSELRLIPVVVHIVHNGQAEGVGSNVPTSQILEQIRILNEDFRRLNADAVNTPGEFLPVAADANIEFVLAKQDPNGLPTDGIIRIQGPKTNYNPETDATIIGQLSQWNPEEYLNLWVVPLINPYIGYASFPISDLPGLNSPPNSALTDGVTIDYRFFGVGGSAISASLGRTATHEVGHYLGLRHIWGDGGCGVDDFVADTPEQDSSNNSCSPNFTRTSCGSTDMIQNYMDYTPDACMNLFTQGQVERFNVVLENSPRRVTLVNNRATQEPELLDVDLAISKIISPSEYICSTTVSPAIEVLNAGNNRLTSGRIELRRNGTLLESKRVTFDLETGESTTVSFNDFNLQTSGTTVEFKITEANDQPDMNESNNIRSSTPLIQEEITLPYTLDLNNFPGQFTVENPDESFTWEKTTRSISGVSQPLVTISNYNYEAPGELDYFISPLINLEEYPNAQIVFELAYANYDQAGFEDQLIVAVSQDCGNNFDLANATYQKFGQSLETVEATLDEFFVSTSSQFRTEIVNLSEYRDLGTIRFAFINQNSYGNNLFIRNIRILPTEQFKYELSVNEMLTPSPIADGEQDNEIYLLQNTGNLPVSKFIFSKSTNDGVTQTFLASGSTVEPGENFTLSSPKSTISGKNKIEIEVRQPNFDQNGDNSDDLTRYIIEDDNTILTPWRQNFNNSSSITPINQTINPESDQTAWEIIPINSGEGPNNVARLQNQEDGNTYWLGTSIFDLSSRKQASVFFDLAAGEVSNNTTFNVLVSTNGGQDFSIAYQISGSEISTVSSGEANPNSVNDFARKYVNLTEYAGLAEGKIRLAFVVAGGSSEDSPIYLDNIELFQSANPDPVIPGEGMSILYPNPARDIFNIAFNLAQFEDVNIQVISTSGMVVQDLDYPGTLNQTYSFSTELFSKGVFIIKITSPTIQETRRLIIN